ncbi:hypothetical protein GCM10010252_19650 [Streptomyces aureoverticillatus]|nr:hypothetical protein GCM10010252_19650 [Streptomyces aureoverticillatus]
MTKEQGTGDVLKVDAVDGCELPAGSMKYPPCQCPQHRAAQTQEGRNGALHSKVRAANERSRGERL